MGGAVTTVYTAIMGAYDFLIPNKTECRQHICFTDTVIQSLGWETRVVARRFDDPRREARMYKALPHLFLPDADITIWHDGDIGLKVPPDEVACFADGYDVAAFQHPWHSTLTEEAKAVIRTGRAEAADVNEQMSAYLEDGYSDNYQPFATGVLIRRNTTKIAELNSHWWAEMTRHTLRDQLSFNYLCWRLGIERGTIPGYLWPGLSPDVFQRSIHREAKFHTR